MTLQNGNGHQKNFLYASMYSILFPSKKNMRSALVSFLDIHPKTLLRKEKKFNESTPPFDIEYWECHGKLSESDWQSLHSSNCPPEFAFLVQANLTPPQIVRGVHPTYQKFAMLLVGLRNANPCAPKAFCTGCDYLLSLLRAFSQLYYCSLHEKKDSFMKYLAILPANKLDAESLWQEYLHMQQKASVSNRNTLQELLLELLETAFLTLDVIFFTPILLGEKHLGHSLLLAFLVQVSENPKKKALHYAMHYIRTIIVNNLGEKVIYQQSDRLMYTLLSKHEGEHEAIRKAVERMRKKPATPEAFDDFLVRIAAVPSAQGKALLLENVQFIYCVGGTYKLTD